VAIRQQKIFEDMFIHFDSMYKCDTHTPTYTDTDGHRMTAKAALDGRIPRQ